MKFQFAISRYLFEVYNFFNTQRMYFILQLSNETSPNYEIQGKEKYMPTRFHRQYKDYDYAIHFQKATMLSV